MTKQILAFLFCFTRELNLYTPLTDIVIIHIFYINESNPYTPLVTIFHIHICYQLLQTRPTGEKRYQLLQTTHSSVHLSTHTSHTASNYYCSLPSWKLVELNLHPATHCTALFLLLLNRLRNRKARRCLADTCKYTHTYTYTHTHTHTHTHHGTCTYV
jgi:hypothetical protein